MDVNVPELDKLLQLDPYLNDFQGEIKRRFVIKLFNF